MSLSDEDRYELGKALGGTIYACFAAIAKIDGVTVQDAMDYWVATYFAERVSSGD